MFHSNSGELHQLFSTFNRVWGAGGYASLSLKTVDNKLSAVLEVQLGPPSAPRPGAPEAHQAAGNQNQQPDQQRRRRHRGPGRQARDAARRDAWVKQRLENQSSSQVPPPPPPPPTPPPPPPPTSASRLIKFVGRKAGSRSTFCQLDGVCGSVESESGDISSPTSPPSSPTPTSTASSPSASTTPSALTSQQEFLAKCPIWQFVDMTTFMESGGSLDDAVALAQCGKLPRLSNY